MGKTNRSVVIVSLLLVLLGSGDAFAAQRPAWQRGRESHAPRAKAPKIEFKLEPGKSYIFAYECLPQVGCFAEAVTVIAVDEKANRVLVFGDWWINLSLVRTTKELKEAPTPAEKPAPEPDPSVRVAWNRNS